MPSQNSHTTTVTTTPRSRGGRQAVGWVVAVVAVAVQLAALYWPTVTVEGPVSWSDKVMHVLLFALPTYAVGLALRRIAPVALVFAVHAPVSELVQHVVLPHRSGDVWDVVMDLLGVGLGVLALVVHRAVVVRARSRPLVNLAGSNSETTSAPIDGPARHRPGRRGGITRQ